MYIFADYETRGRVDLPSAGAYEYVDHPETEILMVGILVDGKARIEDRLVDLGSTDRAIVTWGQFDALVYRRKEKGPYLQFIDAQALALMVGLPKSLEAFCRSVGIEAKKDPRGTRLINTYSKPQPDGSFLTLAGEDRKAFEEYCLQDVYLLEKAWTVLGPLYPEWVKTHLPNYLTVEAMNDNGVPIDGEAVENALAFIQAREMNLTFEFREITGLSPSQSLAVAEWFGLPDVKRDTLQSARFDDPRKEKAREIRLELASASIKKLKPMLEASQLTGRVRGCFINNGAITGRCTSHLVQFQNMKRAKIHEPYFDALLRGQDVMEPIKEAQNNIRGFIKPPAGKLLVVADYAQVEARVLAWLAAEDEMLRMFSSGQDVYKEFASLIFQTPVDKITDHERQLGKIDILGCFGPDTPVLTDEGWKPILSVTTADKVWDGENWVWHDGPIDRGLRDTITKNGITATPEHLIWAEGGWLEWSEVCGNPRHFRSALLSANLPWLPGSLAGEQGALLAGTQSVVALAGGKDAWIDRTCAPAGPLDAELARGPKPRERRSKNTSDMPTSAPTRKHASDCSTELPLVYPGATIPAIRRSDIMAEGAFLCGSRGGTLGPERSVALGIWVGPPFWPIFSRFRGTIGWSLTSIGLITSGGTSRETYALPLAGRTLEIGERSGKCRSEYGGLRKKTRVYDLLNAGPRKRFTVLTNAGPLLVHNSGYGVGGPGLARQALGYGVTLSERQAWGLVRKYRETFPNVPKLWNELELAARLVVQGLADEAEAGRCKFSLNKSRKMMIVELPSGRRLRYAFPKLVEGYVTYTTRLGVNTTRKKLWGGHLTENLCQAIAADLKFDVMGRFREELIMEVHDEIVLEVDETVAEVALRELIRAMEVPPRWFTEPDLIKAEGKVMRRYSK